MERVTTAAQDEQEERVPTPPPLLEVSDLTLKFGGVTALNGVERRELHGRARRAVRRDRPERRRQDVRLQLPQRRVPAAARHDHVGRQANQWPVFLVATPSDAAKIWGTAAQAQYAPQWFGQSPAYTGVLAQSPVAPYMEQRVLMVSEATEWGDEEVPGMKQMVADVAEFAPDQAPDHYFAFGYNQARAMTALLEKAVELGDLSREGILEASNQLGTVTFDGLTATTSTVPPRTATRRVPVRSSRWIRRSRSG